MDEIVVKAVFAPLVTAIVTQGVQILVEWIKSKPQPPTIKWLQTMIVSMAVALVVAAIAFAIISNTTHCAVSNLGWKEYTGGGSESTINTTPVPVSDSKCAFEVSFFLKEKGNAVAAYQKVEPRLVAWWVKGIEFSYRSPGSPNSLVFKLFDKDDIGYSVMLGPIRDTGDGSFSQEVPYASLRAIQGGAIFHRKGFEADRMDFTLVSRSDSTPGAGTLTILDIRLVPIWQVWLIVLSPVLLLAGIAVGYVIWEKYRETRQPPKPAKTPTGATRRGAGNTGTSHRRKANTAASRPSQARQVKK